MGVGRKCSAVVLLVGGSDLGELTVLDTRSDVMGGGESLEQC
jgi:hypothetical protein